MNDLISRQATIVEICKAGCQSNPCRVLCSDAMAVKAVPSANQWIPVFEKLPNHGQEIWVCSKNGAVWHDAFCIVDGVSCLEGPIVWEAIVAWMPFERPEPYKEIEE